MPLPLKYALYRLGEWATAATGLAVLQADQAPDLARRTLPYLGLSRLPGTWDGGRPRRRNRLDVPTEWALDFSAVVGTDPANVVIEGQTIEVDGEAAGDARDAWLEAFEAARFSQDGWVEAAADGATGVTLVTGSGWAPPRVEAGQQIALTVADSADLEIWRTPVVTRWRLQVYGVPGSYEPERALAALRREAERDPPPGLRLPSAPVVLSLPYQGGRELRGYVDLDLALEDLSASPLVGLASVTLSQTVGS